ncbi:MAG TPA: hypothetical protein VFZ58_05235 [Candidatus Saccharimonadales bacterium]
MVMANVGRTPRPERKSSSVSFQLMAVVVVVLFVGLVGGYFAGLNDLFGLGESQPVSGSNQIKTSGEGYAKIPADVTPSEPGLKNYCPNPGSREAKNALRSKDIDVAYSGDVLVMGENPIVRIVGEGSISGSLQICGPGAVLVLEKPGVLGESTILEGEAAVVLLPDQDMSPEISDTFNKVILNREQAKPTFCHERRQEEATRHCRSFY